MYSGRNAFIKIASLVQKLDAVVKINLTNSYIAICCSQITQ